MVAINNYFSCIICFWESEDRDWLALILLMFFIVWLYFLYKSEIYGSTLLTNLLPTLFKASFGTNKYFGSSYKTSFNPVYVLWRSNIAYIVNFILYSILRRLVYFPNFSSYINIFLEEPMRNYLVLASFLLR